MPVSYHTTTHRRLCHSASLRMTHNGSWDDSNFKHSRRFLFVSSLSASLVFLPCSKFQPKTFCVLGYSEHMTDDGRCMAAAIRVYECPHALDQDLSINLDYQPSITTMRVTFLEALHSFLIQISRRGIHLQCYDTERNTFCAEGKSLGSRPFFFFLETTPIYIYFGQRVHWFKVLYYYIYV